MLSAIISAATAYAANQQAKKASKRQMGFQAEMSNTAIQRQVADMRAAGINPILAAKYGGASTPAGATYTPSNVGAAAMQGYQQYSSAKQMQQQAKVGAEQVKQIEQTTKNLLQDNEIKAVLHDERWPRMFAGMSDQNILASVIAAINNLDVESVLKGEKISGQAKVNLYQFLREVQANKSKLQAETYGIGRLMQDALNAVAPRMKESSRESKAKLDFTLDALKEKRSWK